MQNTKTRRIPYASAVLLLCVTFAHAVRHRARAPWVSPLPGSHASQLRQNQEIDRLLLPRIVNDEQLRQLIATGELARITPTQALRISVAGAPYCRPWTLDLLRQMSSDYFAQFGAPLTVTSAVRTQEQQRRLRGTNHNAAPIAGDTASSHMAGISIDIARRGLSHKQSSWITGYLRNLRDAGKIEVAMETRQLCWHIAVMSGYSSELK